MQRVREACVIEDIDSAQASARNDDPLAFTHAQNRVREGIVRERTPRFILPCGRCGAEFTIEGTRGPDGFGLKGSNLMCTLSLVTPPSIVSEECDRLSTVVQDAELGAWVTKLSPKWFTVELLSLAQHAAIESSQS